MTHAGGRALFALIALVSAAAVVLGPMPAGAQATPDRSTAAIRLNVQRVDAGDWVTVRGEGFPAGVLVLVQVCGANATPALGCDDQTAIDAAVDRNGSFEIPLHVNAPPSPCPCAVRAVNQAEGIAASAPIEIVGAKGTAEAAPTGSTGGAALLADVSVSDVALVGDDDWTTWFGASPTRTFQYTVRNKGPGTADGLQVDLRGGHDGATTVLKAPPVGSLGPGEERAFEVQVDLGPFARGDYRVVGTLSGLDDPAAAERVEAFGAETSSFPWMVLVIPAVVLFEVLLLMTRNRMRDRVQDRATVTAVAPAVAASVVERVERTRSVGVDTRIVAGRVVEQLAPGVLQTQAPGSDALATPDLPGDETGSADPLQPQAESVGT